MDTPGISITCPAEGLPSEPILIEAVMRADARTYWDNDGILDKALTIGLVRCDRPGLLFLDKIDPRALMMPDEPLPGRPTDSELAADTGIVTEVTYLDVGSLPRGHQGSADYLVTAAFSTWWGGVRPLRINGPDGTVLPSNQAPQLGPGAQPWVVRHSPTTGDPSIRLERTTEGAFLVLPLQGGSPPMETGQGGRAWLTVLAFKMDTRGGACGGLFDLGLRSQLASVGGSGEAVIALSALTPRPDAGCWIVLGFNGDGTLPPSEIWLADDDVR